MRKKGSFWGFWVKKLCEDPKTLFWRGHLELSIGEGTRSNGQNGSRYDPFLGPKMGHFTHGSKTCFVHIFFKSTLYKNRSFYKPCVPGGTVTRFWFFWHYEARLPGFQRFPCPFWPILAQNGASAFLAVTIWFYWYFWPLYGTVRSETVHFIRGIVEAPI